MILMGISQPLPVQAAAPIRAAHATDAAATPATTPAAGDAWSKRAVTFMELI